MVDCSTFVNDVECVLNYTNDFDVKLILLLVFGGFLLLSIYMSKDWDAFYSFNTLMLSIAFNVVPKILLAFYPFFILLLRHTVSIELMITLLTLVYGIVAALLIGLSLLKGTTYIQNMFNDFQYKYKYMKK